MTKVLLYSHDSINRHVVLEELIRKLFPAESIIIASSSPQLSRALRVNEHANLVAIVLAQEKRDLEEISSLAPHYDGVLLIVIAKDNPEELLRYAYQLKPRAVLQDTTAELQLLGELLTHYSTRMN